MYKLYLSDPLTMSYCEMHISNHVLSLRQKLEMVGWENARRY